LKEEARKMALQNKRLKEEMEQLQQQLKAWQRN
jgi:hypothetical protein